MSQSSVAGAPNPTYEYFYGNPTYSITFQNQCIRPLGNLQEQLIQKLLVAELVAGSYVKEAINAG